MKALFLSCLGLFLIAFTFSSCEQETKRKLIGQWKLLSLSDTLGYEEDWKFTDTELILTHTNTGDSVKQAFKNGTYSIKNSTITTTGEGLLSNGGEYYRGDFEIRTLDGTELILLRRDLGMQYYEFEKKQ